MTKTKEDLRNGERDRKKGEKVNRNNTHNLFNDNVEREGVIDEDYILKNVPKMVENGFKEVDEEEKNEIFDNIRRINDEKREKLSEWEREKVDEEIIRATENRDINEVVKLVLNGADINAYAYPSLHTPLMICIDNDYKNLAKFLIDIGSKLSPKNNNYYWTNKIGNAGSTGRFGVKNKTEIKSLIKAVRDIYEGEDIRTNAALTLANTGIDNNEVIEAFAVALKGWEGEVSKIAAQSLLRIAKKNNMEKKVKDKLVEVLYRKEDWEKELEFVSESNLVSNNTRANKDLIFVLGELGVEDKKIIDDIVESIINTSQEYRKAVVNALIKIAEKNKIEEEIIEKVIELINEKGGKISDMEEPGIITDMFSLIEKITVKNNKVIGSLIKALGSENLYIRGDIFDLLIKMINENKVDGKIVVEKLIEIMNSTKNEEIKLNGIALLGELEIKDKKTAKKAMSILVSSLKDENEDIREAASMSYNKIISKNEGIEKTMGDILSIIKGLRDCKPDKDNLKKFIKGI